MVIVRNKLKIISFGKLLRLLQCTFPILLLWNRGGNALDIGMLIEKQPTYSLRKICVFNLETCKSALGMESGAIADFQITASSAHDPGNVGPQHAR